MDLKRYARILAVFIAALISKPATAAIDANALAVAITQEQQVDGARSGSTRQMGTSVRTLSQFRILHVTLQNVGAVSEEALTLRWIFVFKDIDAGRFGYHSQGSGKVVLPRRGKLTVKIASKSVEKEYVTERGYFYSSQFTGGQTPWGWILEFVQGDKVVKQEASDFGLLEWSRRNPPPKNKGS